MNNKSNKKLVLDLYKKVIGDRNADLIDDFISDNYIQHSPSMRDGKDGLRDAIEFLKRVPKPEESKSPLLLALADNDYVMLLLELTFMEKHLCVADLFKVIDGKIVEHWDAVEEVATKEVPSFNPDEAAESTCDIKSLVRSLYETSYPEISEVNKQFTADIYSRSALKVHRIICEGTVVAVQSQGQISGKSFVFYDFIKIQNSVIFDFWNVKQEIPHNLNHNNGML